MGLFHESPRQPSAALSYSLTSSDPWGMPGMTEEAAELFVGMATLGLCLVHFPVISQEGFAPELVPASSITPALSSIISFPSPIVRGLFVPP